MENLKPRMFKIIKDNIKRFRNLGSLFCRVNIYKTLGGGKDAK